MAVHIGCLCVFKIAFLYCFSATRVFWSETRSTCFSRFIAQLSAHVIASPLGSGTSRNGSATHQMSRASLHSLTSADIAWQSCRRKRVLAFLTSDSSYFCCLFSAHQLVAVHHNYHPLSSRVDRSAGSCSVACLQEIIATCRL